MEIKRIFELAEKAGAFPLDTFADNTVGFRERALERFAKSIAAECANLCLQDYRTGGGYGVTNEDMRCAALIKEEFEIE
jgi:hypothetical protein